jgi:hypothetical protein
MLFSQSDKDYVMDRLEFRVQLAAVLNLQGVHRVHHKFNKLQWKQHVGADGVTSYELVFGFGGHEGWMAEFMEEPWWVALVKRFPGLAINLATSAADFNRHVVLWPNSAGEAVAREEFTNLMGQHGRCLFFSVTCIGAPGWVGRLVTNVVRRLLSTPRPPPILFYYAPPPHFPL